MKEKVINALRWIAVLPASVVGSYLVYLAYYWLNRTYIFTNGDYLWNHISMFIASMLMGGTFIAIGVSVAPSHQKVCASVMFGFWCIISGAALFANIVTGFSWTSFISLICSLIGAGYAFYASIKDNAM